MKYFIIAGEASGDLHASGVCRQLRRADKNALIVGFGGDKMKKEGCDIKLHISKMAFMGVVAVLKNLKQIKQNFALARKTILEEKPDALILIDYPSFNLKIAKFVHKNLPQTKIYYYIPPKVWAWKKWRVHKIAEYSHRILTIFPFETDFYSQYGYEVTYVGNPTAEAINDFQKKHNTTGHQDDYIVLMPGSRKHEIQACLPVMLRAALHFSQQYKIKITAAPAINDSIYTNILADINIGDAVEVVRDKNYQLLSGAKAAIVNSGTATLETALLNCPQVAVYHLALPHLVALIRPLLFTIPYFTLVNIIGGKQIIRELLAYEFTEDNVRAELEKLLNDSTCRKQMQSDYATLHTILGNNAASKEVADIILHDFTRPANHSELPSQQS